MRIIFMIGILVGLASANQCDFYLNKLSQDLYFYKEAKEWRNKERILSHIEKNLKKVKQNCKGSAGK